MIVLRVAAVGLAVTGWLGMASAAADSVANAEELCRKFAKMDQILPNQLNAYVDQCVRDMVETEAQSPKDEMFGDIGGHIDLPVLHLPE